MQSKNYNFLIYAGNIILLE